MAPRADTLEIEPTADGFLPLRDLNDAVISRAIALDSDMYSRMRWVPDAREWRVYEDNSGVWRTVESPVGALDAYLQALAAEYDARALAAEAQGNDDHRKYFRQCAARVRQKLDGQGRRALLTSIQGIVGACPMHALAAQFDAHPHLLCVRNGVLDLATMPPTLKPHDPALLMTKSTTAAYDASAECPRYLEAVRRSQAEVEERALYVLRVLGRGLLGGECEDVWNWQGSGFNLKGAVATPALRVLGDYAGMVAPATLLQTTYDHHTSFKGSLAGKRFLLLDELPPDPVIDAGKVKQLLSPAGFKAQLRMHGPAVDTRVAATLIIISNPIPRFWACENAERRRFTRVAFRVNAEREYGVVRDTTWSDRIAVEEGPGILRLLATAAAQYLADKRAGLDPLPKPASVVADTEELWAESDPTREFLSWRCQIEDGAEVPFAALYREFVSFTTEQNHRVPVLSSRKFRHWVSQRQTASGKPLETVERGKDNTVVWIGIRLKTPDFSATLGAPNRTEHQRAAALD